MTPTVSCIVPAFNEAARIAQVLRAVAGHPALMEVIVIDDGSSDGTADVAAGIAGITLIRQTPNRGKTFAVTQGLAAARGSHVLLVDADLIGIGAEQISALLAPVIEGRADVAISLRRNAPRAWHWLGIDYISGERVLPRDWLLPEIPTLRALPRFGLEVYMNRLLLARRARIAVVKWPGVDSPLKGRKFGWVAGIKADLRMLRDMQRTVGFGGVLRQIFAMRAARI